MCRRRHLPHHGVTPNLGVSWVALWGAIPHRRRRYARVVTTPASLTPIPLDASPFFVQLQLRVQRRNRNRGRRNSCVASDAQPPFAPTAKPNPCSAAGWRVCHKGSGPRPVAIPMRCTHRGGAGSRARPRGMVAAGNTRHNHCTPRPSRAWAAPGCGCE